MPGLIFAENDVRALAHSLQRFQTSPAERRSFALRGRARVLSHYTMRHVAAQTVHVYTPTSAPRFGDALLIHIAINAQLLSSQESYRGAGVSNYSLQLLRALGACANERDDLHLTAFVHTPSLMVDGVELVHSQLPLERPLPRIAWEQVVLPFDLRRRRPDVIHGLMNVLPLASRIHGVVTVHDLSFVRTPEKLPPLKRAYLLNLCRASVRRAARVIAVSRQTRDDIIRYFGVAPERVRVVYNGVAPEFSPADQTAIERFRHEKGLTPRFLLYLGTLEPRKNLELLVRAYARWRAQAPPEYQDVKLVLAGGKGWYYNTIYTTVEALQLEESVLFPGFLPRAELVDWYRAALGFVYPSVFEGFGLPVLEAMASGTPVLCSQESSLLEVVGDAALTFPTSDGEALANGLHLIVTQPNVRAELSRRGRARAAEFFLAPRRNRNVGRLSRSHLNRRLVLACQAGRRTCEQNRSESLRPNPPALVIRAIPAN